jgi:hypothetical protein
MFGSSRRRAGRRPRRCRHMEVRHASWNRVVEGFGRWRAMWPTRTPRERPFLGRGAAGKARRLQWDDVHILRRDVRRAIRSTVQASALITGACRCGAGADLLRRRECRRERAPARADGFWSPVTDIHREESPRAKAHEGHRNPDTFRQAGLQFRNDKRESRQCCGMEIHISRPLRSRPR